jgi:hypothetical protein
MRSLGDIFDELGWPHQGYTAAFIFNQHMDQDVMEACCPHSEPVCRAELRQRRFMINQDGLVTSEESAIFKLYGVIWHIPNTELPQLDAAHQAPGLSYRVRTFAHAWRSQAMNSVEPIPVEYYRTFNTQDGQADLATCLRLLALARVWRFPDEYLEQIGTYAPDEWRSFMRA